MRIDNLDWKNWWYYYKWYVLSGAALFLIICTLIGNALGLFTKSPDLQIAYVGSAVLPQDTINAIQETFCALAEDYNRDGEIMVQVNQYILNPETIDTETAHSEYASEITLMADISEGESYFYLLDDPQKFQQEYQLLATPDGDRPNQADYSTEDKVFLWKDCPLLADAEMGSYTETVAGQTVTGSNQELLADLYFGRRCFYNDKVSNNMAECSALWDILYDSRIIPANRT